MADEGIGSALSKFGFNVSGIERIKLGAGLVGRLTSAFASICVVMFVAILGATHLGSVELLEKIVYLAIGVFVLYIFASLTFAFKNPAASVLEGAELVRYREIEMGARGIIVPTAQQNVIPEIAQSEGGNDA